MEVLKPDTFKPKQNICRTCLKKDEVLHSVFDVCLDGISFKKVISEATGVEIENGNGISTNICSECKEKVAIVYEFKKKTLECNEYFKEIEDYFIKEDNEEDEDINVVDSEKEMIEHISLYDFDSSEFDNGTGSPMNFDYNLQNIDKEEETPEINNECKSCGAILDSNENFNEHIEKCVGVSVKVEHFEDEHTCDQCDLNFTNAELLLSHISLVHNQKNKQEKKVNIKKTKDKNKISNAITKVRLDCFTSKYAKSLRINCGICTEEILGKHDVTTHLDEHKAQTVYCCVRCKSMYLNKTNFESHPCIDAEKKDSNENEEDKTENSDSTNQQDKMQYLTEVLLGSILETENPTEDLECLTIVHVCATCTAMFLSTDALLDHIDKEHPKLSHRCLNCMKVFSSSRNVTRHAKVCKKLDRIYKCSTCGLGFPYEATLNKHILRSHKGQGVSIKWLDKVNDVEKKFNCDVCNKRFHRQELLDKHSRSHLPDVKKYTCNVCEKQFIRPDSLRTHMIIHEPEDKLVEAGLCLYCGRRFANSSNLVVHMRRHTGEKPYKCDFCDKGFPRSTDLLYHRRSHTGERPCVCNVCGKAFSTSNKLTRHMRIHTGSRPYKCTYCDKAFTQSNDLKVHIRRHTGDKPYICDVCGERFIQNTTLQSHRRNYGHFPADPTMSTAVVITSKAKLAPKPQFNT